MEQQGSDMLTNRGVCHIRVHTGKERVQPGSSEPSGVWYLAQRHLGRGPGTSPATPPTRPWHAEL